MHLRPMRLLPALCCALSLTTGCGIGFEPPPEGSGTIGGDPITTGASGSASTGDVGASGSSGSTATYAGPSGSTGGRSTGASSTTTGGRGSSGGPGTTGSRGASGSSGSTATYAGPSGSSGGRSTGASGSTTGGRGSSGGPGTTGGRGSSSGGTTGGQGCRTDRDCAPDQWCHWPEQLPSGAGVCEPRVICPAVVIACDPAPGFSCTVASNPGTCPHCECEPLFCSTDAECGQGAHCEFQDCGPLADCAGRGRCATDSSCEALACAAPADPTWVCEPRTSPDGCPQCPYCHPPEPQGCGSDADCRQDQFCSFPDCDPSGLPCPQIEPIGMCVDRVVCPQVLCMAPPTGWVCEPPVPTPEGCLGCPICKPVPACVTDADCDVGEGCEAVVCTANIPSCSSVPPGSTQACCPDGPQCVPVPACTSDRDCTGGETCQPDPNDPCNGTTALCLLPGRSTCQPPAPTGCVHDSDCDFDERCEINDCPMAPCAPGMACPDVCGAPIGQCVQVPTCSSDRECASNEQCLPDPRDPCSSPTAFCNRLPRTTCQATGGSCTRTADCDEGLVCRGQLDPSCLALVDCAVGYDCSAICETGPRSCEPSPICFSDSGCRGDETCQLGCNTNCDPSTGSCADCPVASGRCIAAPTCFGDRDCANGTTCQLDPTDPCNQPGIFCTADVAARMVCRAPQGNCGPLTCNAADVCMHSTGGAPGPDGQGLDSYSCTTWPTACRAGDIGCTASTLCGGAGQAQVNPSGLLQLECFLP